MSNLIFPPPGKPPGSSTPRFGNLKQASSRPPGGFFGAKTSSETLPKRNGSFPSVKSDSATPPGSPRESQTSIFKASRPPGGFLDAKTSSETLRKRNGSFPSVKSDSATPLGSPREAQPPVSGISNKHLQGLPGAFLAPKRLPKRCENATVRSQVSNLIFPPPREAPGKLNPPFRESQTGILRASRGLF